MHRFAVFVLAALVLAPAGAAARGISPGHLEEQPSFSASLPWSRISNWDLTRHWSSPQAPRSSAREDASTARQTALETGLVREINGVRRVRGLKPLLYSAKLTAAAVQHTREMGADGYFEHESFDSTEFWKRIARWYPSRGFSSWSVGENLLYSAPEVEGAGSGVDDWMSSPGHRANLLNRSWREIGIAAIHFDNAPGEYGGGPVTIVTADFGYRR
jgi:uncharacterized protein YkwD